MVSIRLFFITNAIYFAPLFFTVYAAVDFSNKKTHFCVKLFGVTVLGGYITAGGGEIYIHLGEKIAFVFNPIKFLIKRKGQKLSVPKVASVFLFKSDLLVHSGKSSLPAVLSAFLYAVNCAVAPAVKNKKGYMRIKNDLTISEKNYGEAFFVKTVFATNLFALNSWLTVKIFEGIIKKCKAKKTT